MAIVVFGVGQLVLPPLAVHIARGRLAARGHVLSLSISAVPAVELLWGHADTVRVRMSDYDADPSQVASNLGQAGQVANLSASIGSVHSGALQFSDVSVIKHGRAISARGRVSEANLRAVVPLLASVVPVASGNGVVTLQGQTRDLPLIGSVSAQATVSAQNGQLVLSGTGLLGSLLHITVFSDPRVSVTSIAGQPAPGGLALSARALLR